MKLYRHLAWDGIRKNSRLYVPYLLTGVGAVSFFYILVALARLRAFYPVEFQVHAITLETGTPGMCFDAVADLCRELEVPDTRISVPVYQIVFEERKEKNPCSLCARMRRGAINNWAHDNGCNKVALGHHMDDCIETLLMSLFYEGRIHTFAPRSYLTRSQVTVIRPLVYVSEADITRIGARLALPLVKNKCPADGHTTRSETKDLLASLAVGNPRIKERIMSGIDKDLWQHYRITPSEEE